MHYNAQTVLYFVGYSYIMDMINAQKMKHIKSTLQPIFFLVCLFVSSPPPFTLVVNITSWNQCCFTAEATQIFKFNYQYQEQYNGVV